MADPVHPSPECPCDVCALVRRTLASFVRHGHCEFCGDDWTERGEIVVCPECSSTNVVEVER